MKIFKPILFLVVAISLLLAACGAPQSSDGYDSAPSNAFIIEAGSGAESFLSPQSNSGKVITDTADFYPVFFNTNKVKNNLNLASAKGYPQAQAFILESPHWASIPGQTIAKSEVGFGMTGDLMRSLGLTPGQPTYLTKQQMVDLISTGVLNPDVCNPTQCNEGELFYFAVVSHYSGKSVMDFDLTDGTPESQAILQQTKDLMGKVNITTSTDKDARDAFINNVEGYNAFWGYEPEIANINFIRVSQGLEPIYMVYVDGTIDAAVTLFFSPYYQLTEADIQDQQKVDSYKATLDEYNKIASTFEKDETIRKAIADAGWDPTQYKASASTEVLKPEWGFVTDPPTSTGFAGKYEVSMALNSTFVNVVRDPVILFFFDDDSGSMGDYTLSNPTGKQQLVDASYFIFGPKAEEEFLNAIDLDITKVYMFDHNCVPLPTVEGRNTQVLADQIASSALAGNTSMFYCGQEGLNEMAKYQDKCKTSHNCAFVFLTDGADNDCPEESHSPCANATTFNELRTSLQLDFIPVYAIPVGGADVSQINEINGVQVCLDAKNNMSAMIDCFKKIKGSR